MDIIRLIIKLNNKTAMTNLWFCLLIYLHDGIAVLSSKHQPPYITQASDIWPVTADERRAGGALTFSTSPPFPTYLTTAPWVRTKWSDSGSKRQFFKKEKSRCTKPRTEKRKGLMRRASEREASLEIDVHNSLLLL